ncbi:RING finger protein 212B-like [Anopheles coustani]|uniref:RING finger protein 212B-like n=1 Tax=Anopheles coustani TaxID=139045 RepID=UPI00265AC8EF|nr:RING finger protein 212B-like [Anopheles coustani]
MSPPQWIHCNLCYYVMVRKERKFYHLSCRHVLCKPCMAKTERGTTCPVCHQSLSRFSELNNQMDRKEKMYYDPGAHKTFGDACQIAVFQLKQRENMVRGILRCRKAIPQMKEMFNTLRQRIVETQRQYEKYRTYRRNLQEIMRQNSPAYGTPRAIRAPIVRQPPTSLSIRASERDSRSQLLTPTSGRDRPSILGSGGFVRASGISAYPTPLHHSTSTPKYGQPITPGSEIAHNKFIAGMQTSVSSISSQLSDDFLPAPGSSSVYQTYPHPSTGAVSRCAPSKVPGSGTFPNDSGISGMRTPASTVGSRFSGSRGPSFPMTPTLAKRPHLFHYEQMPSKIARR